MRFIKKHFLTARMVKFAVVGASGVLVNMGLLYLLTEKALLDYRLAGILAIETSILTNFLFNDVWTWRDRQKSPFPVRMLKYHLSAGITALLFNWGLLLLLTGVFGLYYMLSHLAGIACGMLSNYILNNFWTFRERKAGG